MRKKTKKVEQAERKVYKANVKPLIIIMSIAFVVMLVTILAIPIKNGITYLYLNSWKSYKVGEYNIEFKLPRAFKEVETNKNTLSNLSSSLISTNTEVKVKDEYIIRKPEVVYSGGNVLNGISMMIQCFSTEKTTRTLDEIADNQHVLVRIYYEENYKISEPTKEFLTILNSDAVSTSTILTNKKETQKIINYLVPMEDKEVTITFYGAKESMEKYNVQIKKIISELKNV